MAIKDHKYKEPKYLVQPYDNSEYYFKVAKEFKKSQKDPDFTTLNYQDWLKKYKKKYKVSGDGAFNPIEKGDKR
jgi:hypothetical protein